MFASVMVASLIVIGFAVMYAKSIFKSLTFWSIMLLLVHAIIPSLQVVAMRGHFTYADVLGIVDILTVSALGIIGRINAHQPIYTPNGVYGPDKSDFLTPPSRMQATNDIDKQLTTPAMPVSNSVTNDDQAASPVSPPASSAP
jgi:hypothetical protein